MWPTTHKKKQRPERLVAMRETEKERKGNKEVGSAGLKL